MKRTLRPKVGDVYRARSCNEEFAGMTWKMQVLAIVQMWGKRFIVCHKMWVEPSSLQLVLFDIYGDEADEVGLMRFELIEKVKAKTMLKVEENE